ncbi:coiled-coil domain-containing 22 family protein [Imhoffiella purpurea]|uniref:Uncharacterized protein n=1 Tax=Imhoffiella purpurea TaxID=1249627 RepID=W9V418_9GAMM|nr:hypothetical protein [Imhoffiella purpurea]EXJ14079.1 hypothetical protein D779_3041 [Imhoffiella purpurea]
MTETDYLWTYGLAEFSAVSLIAALVFGINWWRLHKRQKKLRRTCKAVSNRIAKEIEAFGRDRMEGRPRGDDPVAFLEFLAKPFDAGDIAEAAIWKSVMDDLHRLLQVCCSKHGVSRDIASPVSVEKDPSLAGGLALGEYPELDGLETGIDDLLDQYQASLSSFSENRNDIGNLTDKCRQLESANKELRHKLEKNARSDLTEQLIQDLDAIEQQNLDLRQLLSESSQHQNALGAEMDQLAEKILSLKSINQEYRRLVQETQLERDSLAEQKRQLLGQLERMNRTYSSLRLEYLKLYRITH